jgi:ABC-type sugar transport system permease subunit/ABC-type glycerol-3-phosphate transport system substrate-binding protein
MRFYLRIILGLVLFGWFGRAAEAVVSTSGFSGGDSLPTVAEVRNQEMITLDIPVLVAGYGADFFKETAWEYSKLRPDVRVHLYGDPRINDKVRTRVMAGDWPDATDAVLLYPRLIAAGRILDLASYLDGPNWEGDARWRDTFRDGVLDRWATRRGFAPDEKGPDKAVYGLPFAHAVWTLFYDKALFRRHGWTPPRTWDEFFVLCEQMQAAGVVPMSLPGVTMRYGDAVLRAAHYNLVGPEGYAAYHALAPGTRTDPRFIRAAEVLRRIAANHLVRGWEGMTHTAAQQAFLDGHCAMTLSASWFANEMRGRLPDAFELGAMNLPVFADGIMPVDTVQVQSGYYFVFRSGDPAREMAAVDFFRFMTSRERVRRFARMADAPVALRAAEPGDYSPRMTDTAALLARSPAAFDAAPATASAAQATLSQALTNARYKLMTGRITAEQFGAELEEAAAIERTRLENVEYVETRHLGKTAALLGLIAGLFGWLIWAGFRGKAGGGARVARNEERLAPLPRRFGAGFVGPAFALYAMFVLLPGLAAFGWALTRWDGFGAKSWAGLGNFRWLLLESDVFWSALKNNLFLMLVPPLFVVPVALGMAAFIQRGGRTAGFFRVVLLFPNLLGGIAAALIWVAAYEPLSGFVNAAIMACGDGLAGIGGPAGMVDWLRDFRGHAWLSQENLYWSLVPIHLWMACGFNLVLYLAAMQGVPAELYEAAELDGATPLRQFFTITLPLIREVLVISAVFLVIGGLNAFELVWLLTSQDPTAGAHTLGTFMVGTLFTEFQVGRAAAIAVILFGLVLVACLAVLRATRREAVEL